MEYTKSVSIIYDPRDKKTETAMRAKLELIEDMVELRFSTDGLHVLETSELPYALTSDGLRFFGLTGVNELVCYVLYQKFEKHAATLV